MVDLRKRTLEARRVVLDMLDVAMASRVEAVRVAFQPRPRTKPLTPELLAQRQDPRVISSTWDWV